MMKAILDSVGSRPVALRMLLAMGVAMALLSLCVILSRTAPKMPSGSVGLPLVAVCVIWGAVPIPRLKLSVFARFALGLAYLIVAFFLLMLCGFSIDCYFFHDCD
jgi:hypothetical protein